MSFGTTVTAVREAGSSVEDAYLPTAYEFTVMDSSGKWLDWYPLQAKNDDEAGRLMLQWGGIYREARAKQQSVTAPAPPLPNESGARASAILRTVPSWRSRLKPVEPDADPDEVWDEELRALRSEVSDLRALAKRLVEQIDIAPGDIARASAWTETLARCVAHCRAAGATADAKVLGDIDLFFRISGLSRHDSKCIQNKEISWFPQIRP